LGSFVLTSSISRAFNRQSVQEALRSIKAKLLQYREVPPTGLALFCGVFIDQEGKEHKIVADIQPLRPLPHSLYQCDSRFHTESLRAQLVDDTCYGFIVIDGSCASFHLLTGDTKQTIFKKDVQLPKKHGRGGQSQNRFARIRMEKRDWYTTDIAELATKYFINPETNKVNVKHLVVSGSANLKNEMLKKLDPRVQKAVVRTYDVQYSGEAGFQQTLVLCEDELLNCRYVFEKTLVAKFFKTLTDDLRMSTYGIDQVIYALEAGAVETLIVWTELPIIRYELSNSLVPNPENTKIIFALPSSVGSILQRVNETTDTAHQWELVSKTPLLDWLLESYQDFGSDLQVISGNSSLASQFVEAFSGVAALLRYPVDIPTCLDEMADSEEGEYSFDY